MARDMRLVALAASLLLLAAAQQPGSAIRLTGNAAQAGLMRGVAPPGTVALDLDGRPVPLAPDGRFILGLDRDAPPALTLTARLAGGRQVSQRIEVARRTWRIQHINLARGTGGPSPDMRACPRGRAGTDRRGARPRLGPHGLGAAIVWPARGRLSGAVGRSASTGRGAGRYPAASTSRPAPERAVAAPADGGRVAPPPGFSLEGNLVILDHGMGLSSAFLHLSRRRPRRRPRLRQGQEVGRVGARARHGPAPALDDHVERRPARPQAVAAVAP